MTVCPIWKKSNELFEKIYSGCTPSSSQSLTLYRKKLSAPAEAGLLYLGIKEGWANISDEWNQSPALVILKQVDEFLFCHLPRMERLATAYKSFKLLKVHTKDPSVRTSSLTFTVLPQQQRRTALQSPQMAASQHHAVIDYAPHRSRLLRLANVARPPRQPALVHLPDLGAVARVQPVSQV
jgi:hypothetical protein